MTSTLGERVRKLRIERGLSQAELAENLVSPSYISLIEVNKRTPEHPVIAALAERLSCSVEYLELGADAEARQRDQLSLRYAQLSLANGHVREALAGFRQLSRGGAAVRREALWGMVQALEAEGSIDQAITTLEALLEETDVESAANPSLLVLLNAQCRMCREVGDINRSVEVGEQAMAQAATLGLQGGEDEIRLASTLVGSYWLRGDFVRAEILAQQVIHRAEGHGSRRSRGSAYWNASLVAEARGRLPLAIEFAERALALFADDTDDRNIARLRVDYAWLLLRKNPPEVTRAEQLLTSAQETLESLNLHLDLAYCRTELARCLLHLNKVDDALRAAESAVSTLAPKHIIETARAHLVLAYARHLSGDTDAAIEAVEQAYAQLDEPNQGWQALSLWRELADLFEHLDSADRAAAAYRRLADAAGAHSVPSPLNVSTSDGGQAPRPDERSNAAQVGSAR